MNLKNYKLIETEDGSTTLYSERYQEACHSTHGARAETRLHYIEGCKVTDFLSEQNSIHILEVGFGTGIGLEETMKVCKDSQLLFTSFEIDPELAEHSLNRLGLPYTKIDSDFIVESETLRVEVIVGDAKQRIKDLKNKYHAIYQDAFSPRQNADLWTVEWFKALKNISEKSVRMSTYSASSSIRKSMLEAGWSLQSGVKFGPKRTSTRADLSGKSDQEIIDRLQRSPVSAITDENYLEYMNEKNRNK